MATIPHPALDGSDIVAVFCGTSGAANLAHTVLSLLSEQERERAGKLRAQADRLDYAIAHLLLLRCLQAITLELRPQYTRGSFGKPAMRSQRLTPPLHFNISHTRGCVACALSRGAEVGIDVEDVNSAGSRVGIAEDVFSVDERRFLAACDETDRKDAFSAMWTMKEAIIKADGRGLAMPMHDFTVDPRLLSVRFADQEHETARWFLACHRWNQFHLAAAAVGEPPPKRVSWIRVECEALLASGS